jgi:polysaccharide biosynthesis transport protein
METRYESEHRDASDVKLLTLGDLMMFAVRRRAIIFVGIFTFLLLGIFYSITATRRYQAEALIEIRKPEDSLGLQSLVQGAQAQEVANPLEEDVTLATKVKELQSEALDLGVIDKLQLEDTDDFKPGYNPISWFFGLFSSPSKMDAVGTPFLMSPGRRVRALRTFNKRLKVEVVAGTRLISISYSSPNPDLSATVVNTLANDLAQYSFASKSKTNKQVSSWVADQLQPVREQADALQKQEAQLRRETESYSIGGQNASGQAVVYSPVLDSLQQSTVALNQAESNRIIRAAVNQIVSTGDPKLISGLAGSALLASGNPQSTTSLDLINNLQAQEAAQRVLISQDELRFGDIYPKLIQEKAQLQALDAALQAETDRLAKRAANDYMIASEAESHTRAEHERLIGHANEINDKFLRYEVVRQEAQDAQQLYTDLNRKLREGWVVAGLQSADMTIVSPAFTPDKPRSPNVPLALLASVFVGGFLGSILAGILEIRDDKINSVKMIEGDLKLPVYTVLPDFNRAVGEPFSAWNLWRRFRRSSEIAAPMSQSSLGDHYNIEVLTQTGSPYAEALRALRTAILMSNLNAAPKVILITSSTSAEGKSTTGINLAATYARAGARTLFVEMDLRRPVIAKRMNLGSSEDGLSGMLIGKLPPGWTVSVPELPNLSCIPGGQRSPFPYELVSSDVMRRQLSLWRAAYDVVILDGPPSLVVADSIMVAEQADLILLITRFGKTTINSLRTAHHLLSRNRQGNLGAVLNAVPPNSQSHYDYYGYQDSPYDYSIDVQGRVSNA